WVPAGGGSKEFGGPPGGGRRPPRRGPAERRPVCFSDPPRGPAEDPGLAGGRLRPLLEAVGARDLRLPDRRRCRGEHHGDRTGDDPRRGRTRVGPAAAAVRKPRDSPPRPPRPRPGGPAPPPAGPAPPVHPP